MITKIKLLIGLLSISFTFNVNANHRVFNPTEQEVKVYNLIVQDMAEDLYPLLLKGGYLPPEDHFVSRIIKQVFTEKLVLLEDIRRDYEKNRLRANSKYKDQRFTFSADFDGITKDNYVRITRTDALADFSKIRLFFNESELKKLSKLNIYEKILISCKIEGTDKSDYVTFTSCDLIDREEFVSYMIKAMYEPLITGDVELLPESLRYKAFKNKMYSELTPDFNECQGYKCLDLIEYYNTKLDSDKSFLRKFRMKANESDNLKLRDYLKLP